jgi:hypothetical protein
VQFRAEKRGNDNHASASSKQRFCLSRRDNAAAHHQAGAVSDIEKNRKKIHLPSLKAG